MRMRLGLATLFLAVSLSSIGSAQVHDPTGPATFAKEFVDAINSKSVERRTMLLHPKSRACINAKTQPYYDWIFSRQLKYRIPANYKSSATPLPQDQALASDGKSDYPLRPTHQLQIDVETSPTSGMTFILLIVHDGAHWREVLPCPRPEFLGEIEAAAARHAQEEQRAQSLAAGLADPLRAEIIALARKGQRIEAIKKYAAASGEDLSMAKWVVDLLVPRQ